MQVGRLLADPHGHGTARDFHRWRDEVRERVDRHLGEFVARRCAEHVRDVPGAELMREVLAEAVRGGKHLRSVLTYLGWRCGADESDAALRAAAGIELLHAFALMQDDVMDGSRLRRGRDAVHVRFARWHAEQGLSGSSTRFGESAATLLSDLCLVWAEQAMRESGVGAAALRRAWPRYDALRSELAVGQFADLVNDARREPGLDEVLAVARRKSGDYTVRGPLELGADLAGCGRRVLAVLGEFGSLVGEAFQLRDDVLGVFGSEDATGKPSGDDLREGKATSVVVLARALAGPGDRARLDELARGDPLDDAAVDAGRELIARTGALERVEELIAERVEAALALLPGSGLPGFAATGLREMAVQCTDRMR